MSSNPQQQPQVMPHPNMYQSMPDDEIDLLDLLRILIRRWKMIVLVTVLVTALAVAYALLAPRVYKSEAILLPPTVSDVEKLNGTTGTRVDSQLLVGKVYAGMIVNLKSASLQKKFFQDNDLLTHLRDKKNADVSEERIFKKFFNEKLSVQPLDKKETIFFTVTLEGSDPEQIAKWTNDFIAMVNEQTVKEQSQGVKSTIEGEKEYVQNQIVGLRQVAQDRRFDRIAALEEAASIARELGIVERYDSRRSQSTDQNNPEIGVAVNTANNPIYMNGTRELEAEINSLKSRKSDDPFIGPLRGLQVKLSELENIVVDNAAISAVRVDQPALAPKHTIKPKRQMVVALGAVVGLMCAIFLAFFLNFIETSKGKLTRLETGADHDNELT
ncbi:Wzz/FepE/Etk N-terminal domain-containing protein [Sulfurovum sp.]|uniref:Wzz/FepE/Etk N-terminal domain-containing protein n=1 Tax=Sulfurovum sp. TaxID=1969726 RepID=UPI003565B255